MKQLTKEQMENFYDSPDPFHYQDNPEDQKRKLFTISILNSVIGQLLISGKTGSIVNKPDDDMSLGDERWNKRSTLFKNALDIGCGEGWITKDLPANKIYGYEQSGQARNRFTSNVIPVMIPDQTYELVVANGVLYEHYDWRMVMGLIRKHARHIVLTGHIGKDEVEEAIQKFPGTQILQLKFPYRDWIWKIRVFDVTLSGAK